ncbi:MAG TPA: UDP-N-acetylglucosamine 2-epimerase (non-hydrolyzing) [Candidatus Cloacimonadota bacterium]|nr:UDP-N-acetylglucosamine 2-epimerase (non-hydrolyzing) [Candidatus Cloacimonadota bacterium]HPT70906.1 UDP-N-acetylglucosamine 2-epimerase (non-hydrolyzing) [Candidatus Cloacimonadota bacterium]
MKILSVIGARPQFIKAALLSKEIRKYHEEILVHTGQHYNEEMSDIFFEQLDIPQPSYNLGVGSGTHGYQTGHMIIELEKVLLREMPDFVLIYGDTNSTVSASLAAVKLHIPVGHVEAGLRNFDLNIPEEVNRLVADHISTLLFAPTETAVDNLANEGLSDKTFLTGDVMYDILLRSLDVSEKQSGIMTELGLRDKDYILATIHRPDNTDNSDNLKNIIKAFETCGENVVVPLHPRTLKEMTKQNIKVESDHLKIITPLGYMDFLKLLHHAKKVITDSGGVQKESYLLKIPCITIYESTSWIETVRDGWNILAKPDVEDIMDKIRNFNPSGKQGNYFGDGHSCERIVEIINQYLNTRS